jgi:hypothetical protein
MKRGVSVCQIEDGDISFREEVERSATIFDEAGSFRWSGCAVASPFVREVERSATTFDEAGSFRWSGRVAESPFVQEVERSATIFDEAGSSVCQMCSNLFAKK